MKFLRLWRWPFGQRRAATIRRAPSHVQLGIELLEDRLVPSTTTSSTAFQLWSQQTFQIDDQTVAAAVGPVSSQSAATQPQNASYGAMIGLPSVFASTSDRGAGDSVAVIDTGIDYNNPNLGGGFGPGYRVIAGYNFVNNTANPMDDNGHGTFVAGIIGSSSATYSGIAPDVNLIALKVLDATGAGTFGNVLNALDWVVANRVKYNIVAVNMSLGSGNYTVNPYTFMDGDLSSLVGNGVFISVAAGNSYYSGNSQQGLDFPAIDPYVASVGAVYDGNFGAVAWANGARDNTTAADVIASFSQRSAALSIMAPGAMVTNLGLNNTFQVMAGTSMASPVIAASAVLLHDEMDALHLSANESTILKDMQATGVTVVDGSNENNNVVHTGLSFKRIDLSAAMNALGTPTKPVTPTTPSAPLVLQPIGNQTVAPGGFLDLTLDGSGGSGGSAIAYSASVLATSSSQAYHMRLQLGLKYAGSYYLNAWGKNEKWLTSASGTWYCILPTGALYRWTGSMATTLQSANLIATLDPTFYADPSKLWNAPASTTAVPSLSITGNQLTIQAPANASGSFQIQVTASSGAAKASQTFTLAIQNVVTPPIAPLTPIATQSMLNNRSLTLALSTTGTSNASILFSAKVLGSFAAAPASLAVNGKQLLIYSAPNFTGGFDVQVTATAGASSTTTTFHVNVTASAVADRLQGDFTGDGLQDTAFFNQDGSWWVSIAKPDGSFVNQNWGQWSAASNWSLITTGDFNGDGKMDVIGFSTSGSWYVGISTGTAFSGSLWAQWTPASNWALVQVGDFNGDGKTDVIGFNNQGSWWVGVSTGAALQNQLWTQWSAASQWSSIRVIDLNGQLDIAGYNNALKKWYVGYSTGSLFQVLAWTSTTPPASQAI